MAGPSAKNRDDATITTPKVLKWLAWSLTVVLIWASVPGSALAVEEKSDAKRQKGGWLTEAGFVTGYGDGALDDGIYRTVLLMVHLGVELNRYLPALKNHRGTLSFFLEPQFNVVLKPANEREFGLGMGLQYAYPVMERISPYVLLVSGPHYISYDSITQASGFNFSSAIGGGVYIELNREMALNLGYRYRHVSNADLKKPNEGIDSHLAVLGLSFFF